MAHQSTLILLRSHLDTTACMQWFGAGAAVGICAWRWGTSPVSAWGLSVANGFGASLVLPLLITILLAIVARTVPSRTGLLAYGDFLNLLPWLLARLQRAAFAFFGVVVAAMLCWGITGSIHALEVALLGSMFGGTCAYIWASMVFIARDLRSPRVQ